MERVAHAGDLDVCQGCAVLEARVDAMQSWQEKQNGSLVRIEEKVDGLKTWMLGVLATALGSAIVTILGLVLKK